MYYFAKAYKKPIGKKKYKDITEKEKQENYIGRIIVQEKNNKAQEVSTRLRFDVFNSSEKIRYDSKMAGRDTYVDEIERDIYVDEIDYDTVVVPEVLSTYMWLSVTDSFCLYPELVMIEKSHDGIQKVYKK